MQYGLRFYLNVDNFLYFVKYFIILFTLQSIYFMPTFTTTTNPKHLTDLSLIIDIEKAIAGNTGVIATGIKKHLHNTPLVLKELRDMAQDNRMAVEDMLGVELVKRIANEL